MLDWAALEKEYEQLTVTLTDAALDTRIRAQKQKRSSQLAAIISLHNQSLELDKTIEQCRYALEHESVDMKELYEQEIDDCSKRKSEIDNELEDVLYPADPNDDRSVFLEIRAGTGGQEAALFATDLFRMYTNYALTKNWRVTVVEEAFTDLGGIKEIIVNIQGRSVYKWLKHESGVHRVQRVPKTEGAGRIHTSTVTVTVLPELDDVDVNINPSDLRIDTYRASGAGGQHVNKTDSAVRITHIPSGLVVACQDERSQSKNRQKALKILQARIIAYEKEKQEALKSAARKEQMGSGERAEKIRTYNFPQNRVSDHRTELSLKKLDMVIDGDMDDLLKPLIEWDRNQRRQHSTLENNP